jgi:hypothetical protein
MLHKKVSDKRYPRPMQVVIYVFFEIFLLPTLTAPNQLKAGRQFTAAVRRTLVLISLILRHLVDQTARGSEEVRYKF